MVEGQVCQDNEVVVIVTSQSQAITTTMIEPICATFSACNAKSTGSTATETTTLSCAAAPYTKRNVVPTGVPLALQSRVDPPTDCGDSLPTIIYPLNPFTVDRIVQYLDNFQAKKQAGGDMVRKDSAALCTPSSLFGNHRTDSENDTGRVVVLITIRSHRPRFTN